MKLKEMSILGACLEDCIHVAGILNFFQVAEGIGYSTEFLGPAMKIHDIISAIKNSPAEIVAISYRLTPDNGREYLKRFRDVIRGNELNDRRYFLGCLPGLRDFAIKLNIFEHIFTGGESLDEVLPILREVDETEAKEIRYPTTLIERIKYKAPYPALRAHFGLPSMEESLEGVSQIANAGVLDIISIAPDQAAQESLQRPEILREKLPGAGGMPIRSRDDLEALYKKTRTGNFPLLRIYSGTQDLVANGQLFQDTINNAWAAVPVFWYSELDGRGPKKLLPSIQEHFNAIRWHAEHDVPVEINDPHQWGLRMAPDHLVVADAYLSARVAKELGVKNYIEQIMFNTPPGNTFQMDLARALAMVEIVQPLVENKFNVIKQTRAGLAYFSPREITAMGQLCVSTLIQMSVKPHIMHVVSYTEGDHAAKPEDVINSCKMISRVIQDATHGLPNFLVDPKIIERKNQLLQEAITLLSGLQLYAEREGENNIYTSPKVLSRAVHEGILDAPQLMGNPAAQGKMKTRIIDGTCVVVDEDNHIIKEAERLEKFDIIINQNRSINDLIIKRKGGISNGSI